MFLRSENTFFGSYLALTTGVGASPRIPDSHVFALRNPRGGIRVCRFNDKEGTYWAIDNTPPACLTVCYSFQDDTRLAQQQPRSAAFTWLPYALIDQVLLAAESQDDLTLRGKELQRDLRTVILSRMRYVQKLTVQSKQVV